MRRPTNAGQPMGGLQMHTERDSGTVARDYMVRGSEEIGILKKLTRLKT